MMRSVIFALLFAGASAFAPSSMVCHETGLEIIRNLGRF
jgi:hypothetical protein